MSDRGQTSYDWQHYIPRVQRKPGVLRNGAPFADMPAPLLAVVGSDFARLSPKAILGAQISLATDFRIPVFSFSSEEEFAGFLAAAAVQKSKSPRPPPLLPQPWPRARSRR